MQKLLLIVILFLVGCPKPTPSPAPIPTPVADASVIHPVDVTCTDVCDHYTKLGCDEALDTPEGHTCIEVCANLLDSSLPDIYTYYSCVLNMSSCYAIHNICD